MLIDWLTVAAQLVNFLVLVWLLKRFLYKPVLQAIDEREKHIMQQLEDAQSQKTEAGKEHDEFLNKTKEFDNQRQSLMNNAINEINAERQRLIDETRSDTEALRLQLRETLRNEQQNLNDEIVRRTRDEVFAIARKALADLASVNLETHISEVFIRRLNELNEEERELMTTALQSSPQWATVRSAFKLPEQLQTAIRQTIRDSFLTEVPVTFETAPHLVNGLELVSNGYKITWNIDEYLSSLKEKLTELLKDETKAEEQASSE